VIRALAHLIRQIRNGEAKLENEDRRAVRPEGNPLARAMMDEVFEPADSLWRGIGLIPRSGLTIRKEYAAVDATKRFGLVIRETPEPACCRCGDVIRGAIRPENCPLFGRVCTPEDPVGPCMVSSEGACAAAYKYRPAE
jgi:hydrogenase expression/formation protein HypD